MINIPTIPFLPRRKRPAVPSGPPIYVNMVGTDDPPEPARANWAFVDEITLTGTPIGLRVNVDGVWLDPIDAVQAAPREIWCTYPTAQTLDGKQYEIVTQPSGIAEANRIVLPQSGTIIAP